MSTIKFPYGKSFMEYDFEGENFLGTLNSSIHHYTPENVGTELVKTAMKKPYGGKTLCELARGKKRVVIIASDHTRPVPSKVIIPPMLDEIRKAEPSADIERSIPILSTDFSI